MSELHLWPLETYFSGDEVITGYRLLLPNGENTEIIYSLPDKYANSLSSSCDAFVLEALFPAMRFQKNLIVHGCVSPSLIDRLEEYQSVWQFWRPGLYRKIGIIADEELETKRLSTEAIMVFSGGVDSCFTAWRHATGRADRWNHDLKHAIMIHGFDIPLRYPKTFLRAAQCSQKILDSVGIELIQVKHSTKKLGIESVDNHGTVLASCLMLLQGRFGFGLIPNSISYYNLLEKGQLPFGSSMLTDPMLSSGSFSVINDGTAETRFDKIEAIADWPEAMQNLRVCLSRYGEIRGVNCCRCEKCVRNILIFRLLGLGLPPCFENDVSLGQILLLKFDNSVFGTYHDLFGRQSEQRNQKGIWLLCVRLSYWKNKLWQHFRNLFHNEKRERG